MFIEFSKTHNSVDNKTKLSHIDFNKLEIKVGAINVDIKASLLWEIGGYVYSKDKTEKTTGNICFSG